MPEGPTIVLMKEKLSKFVGQENNRKIQMEKFLLRDRPKFFLTIEKKEENFRDFKTKEWRPRVPRTHASMK